MGSKIESLMQELVKGETYNIVSFSSSNMEFEDIADGTSIECTCTSSSNIDTSVVEAPIAEGNKRVGELVVVR